MEEVRPSCTPAEDSEEPTTAAASKRGTGTGTGTVSRPPQKRRKVANACEPCRARKTRCDGDRPVCGPCRYRSNQQACLYAKDRSKSEIEQQDLRNRSLIDRIQTLERAITQPPPSLARAQELEEAEESRDANQQPRSPYSGSISNERLRAADRQSTIPAIDAEPSGSLVNAMGSAAYTGARSALPRNAVAVGEFYGASSAAHFTQQVEETIPGINQKLSDVARPEGSRLSASNFGQRKAKSLNLSLPTRDLADALLETYFTKSHSLYPFVDRPLFTRAYEDLWKPTHELQTAAGDYDLGLGTPGLSDSQSVVFHCALNAIFALSCQLSDPELLHRDRESLSQTFFLRCRGLLHVDILDHGSIALVQTLLIVAQYLQSTSFPSRCWTSIGLACRIGQGLGLHVEDPGAFRRTAREVELRRCVWYGCTVMDIIASSTLGRPMMLPCQVTIPLPSTTIEGEYRELDDSPSPTMFYIATIKLYLILGKILCTVYKPWPASEGTNDDFDRKQNTEHIQPTDLEALIALEEELSSFDEGVETCLHWERGTATREGLPEGVRHTVQRQSNILRARYFHVRILLNRPTFLRICRKMATGPEPAPNSQQCAPVKHHLPAEGSLRSQMDIHSSVACIKTAIEQINSLSESATNMCDGAWWYTTFCQDLCTAATILILAKGCLRMHQYFSIKEIHAAWTRCCETLDSFIKRGHPVEHAFRGLRSLYEKFVGIRSRPSTKPHSRSGSVGTEDTQQAGLGGSSTLDAESVPGPRRSDFLGQRIVEDTELSTTVPPMMDFMTQDINQVPFGLIDEDWWRLQHGDWIMNFNSYEG